MTYDRALALLLNAGLPWAEANEIARDVSSGER